MAAVRGERERDLRGLGIERAERERIGHRAPQRQRAGLVEQGPVDRLDALERGAVLDHYPLPHQRPAGDDLGNRHGQPQRAGAGDDEHGDGDHERLVQPRTVQHPAGEGQRGQGMDRRGIEPRGPVRDAHVARAGLPGRAHQAGDLGQGRALPGRDDAHVDRAIDIERAGMDRPARADRHRGALAGQQGIVETALAGDDLAVGGEPFARRDPHHHARHEIDRSHPGHGAVLADHQRPRCRLAEQRIDPGTRAIAHRRVERAPGKQEEQEHQRAVEPGIGPAGGGLVEREHGGERDADRDRHVHVGAAVAQRTPGRGVEHPARIEDRRHADQRREPVEQLARGPFGPRPDADREQHDVHRREGRDPERGEQRLGGRGRRRQFGAARLGREAEPGERLDQVGRGQVAAMDHRDLPGGEIDPGRFDPGHGAQPAFDLGHAPGAMHPGDDQCRLDQIGLGLPRRGAHATTCSRRQRCSPERTSMRIRQRPAGTTSVDRSPVPSGVKCST